MALSPATPVKVAAIGALLSALLAGCSVLPPLQAQPSDLGARALPELRSEAPPEVQKPPYFPQRAVTLLVGAERGSVQDTAARLITPRLDALLGQPVVVVNRGDVGGSGAWAELKRAKADGYTLALVAAPDIQAAALDPRRQSPFALADFAPLANQLQEPGAILVRASSAYQTANDLVAAAKARPGKVAVAVSQQSLADHLAMAELQATANVKLQLVDFATSSVAQLAVMSGQVDAGFGRLSRMASAARSKQGRLLAVMDDRRSDEWQQIPTLRESGVDLASTLSAGYAAPKGTAREIVDYLEWAIHQAVSDRATLAATGEAGLRVRFMGKDAYTAYLQAEGERLKRLPASAWP